MLFNSFEFIFGFLPIVFLGFFFIARRSRELAALWLALASILFYGWLIPRFVPLLLLSIMFNYTLGYFLQRAVNTPLAKKILILAVAINLAFIGVYKYAKFFLATANTLAGSDIPIPEIMLPLGISFFTFTQIAFLVDIYRGVAREYKFIHYLLFVTYFPHLIAGPVIHHGQMMPQFARRETYRFSIDNLTQGLTFFTIGLVKKVLIADNFAPYANTIFDSASHGVQLSFESSWFGIVSYALQLYFDFSGYSDMAIGLSWLFGIRLPINFNSPYKALSIVEFWRRWHMTLSQFLQQYLYIPLGGNRSGKFRRYANLMITMVLGGLWHGANWTFVLWGCLHGIFLIINHMWSSVSADWSFSRYFSPRTGHFFKLSLTFTCVMTSWILFRSDSVAAARIVLCGCLGADGVTIFFPDVSFGLIKVSCEMMLAGGLAIVFFAPNTQEIMRYEQYVATSAVSDSSKFRWRPLPAMGFVVGCFFCMVLSNLEKVSTFLYYQF